MLVGQKSFPRGFLHIGCMGKSLPSSHRTHKSYRVLEWKLSTRSSFAQVAANEAAKSCWIVQGSSSFASPASHLKLASVTPLRNTEWDEAGRGSTNFSPLATEMDLTGRNTWLEHLYAGSQYDTVINRFCSYAAISCSDLCLPNIMSWPASHPTGGSHCVCWQYREKLKIDPAQQRSFPKGRVTWNLTWVTNSNQWGEIILWYQGLSSTQDRT